MPDYITSLQPDAWVASQGAAYPASRAVVFSGLQALPDYTVGGAWGKGTISGTVKIKGANANAPAHRRVRLIRERDGLVMRETWSDPVTGGYSFFNVSTDYTYTVLAYDYEHNFRAVVADNLTPVVS